MQFFCNLLFWTFIAELRRRQRETPEQDEQGGYYFESHAQELIRATGKTHPSADELARAAKSTLDRIPELERDGILSTATKLSGGYRCR